MHIGFLSFSWRSLPLFVPASSARCYSVLHPPLLQATTLWELHQYVCLHSEDLYGIPFKDFSKLGLGPLHRHPRIVQYFNPPTDLRAVPEISNMEIYDAALNVVRGKKGEKVSPEVCLWTAEERPILCSVSLHTAHCLWLPLEAGFG